MPDRLIEPPEVAELVERYVEQQLDDVAKYDNRELLDESGVFSLHLLAARVYDAGFSAGEATQARRGEGVRRRARGDS